MPYLREAVEKKRQQFIKLLIQADIFHKSDHYIQHLTLTELEHLYRKNIIR
ncbi:Fur-regulated basic protein FbpA [Rossellomorea sp. BNER]|uniref:Fur-regulated basic protein FbpA n=1 Tax=Rossellomorea sp. BNER TaxID=2962031 RepID=UPI003AF25D4B|nr:Fur-regulated basic protein FbpA [Rossellomorea sp. BNER]